MKASPVVILSSLLAVAASLVAQQPAADSTWKAPVNAAARKNPLASKPELAAGGQRVFNHNCAACHGDDRRAATKASDLSSAPVQSQSDGELFWKITSGNSRAGMPSWANLPEPQRWQLVLYIRSLKK